jgi:hypothetical protein
MARSGRVHVVIVASVVALALAAGARAVGAETTPGLLTTTDLPAGYTQPSDPRTFPSFSLATIDPSACTETPKTVAGLTSRTLVTFVPPGATGSTPGLSESVLTFPDAAAAKAAFDGRAKNDKARWKCGAVGFVPVGQTSSIATINDRKVKVPNVGSKSFATGGSTAAHATDVPVTVTSVSGQYLVLVGFAAPPNAPSKADIKSILATAQQQLTQ